LVGASKLDPAILDGRILLNVDSEEDGVFTIGSAGGRETSVIWPRPRGAGVGNATVYKLTLSGLLGGHSGVDIHRGRLNGIRGLVRLLDFVSYALSIQIGDIEGGDRSNAIPREASAIIAIDPRDNDLLSGAIETGRRELQVQYNSIEPGIKISLDMLTAYHGSVLSPSDAIRLLQLLRSIPSGIVAMSQDLPGLVETSCNLGVIKTGAATVEITCNSRSSVKEALDDITATIVAIGSLADSGVGPGSAYPGWKPDPNAPTLTTLKAVYKGLFGADPQVAAVHAGLECGVLNGAIPGLDMVSFGPTIVGAHSTRERVHIGSVGRFYRLLSAGLAALAE
jgi:dipeptidase D